MSRGSEWMDRRANAPGDDTARQKLARVVGQFVDSDATRSFVSTAKIMPDGAIRAIDADGLPIKRVRLTLPVNDIFRKMVPIGSPNCLRTEGSLDNWIATEIDPRVDTAMRNVNALQVRGYQKDDPRAEYLNTMNYWMFDETTVKGAGEEMIFDRMLPQEAIVLIATSAFARNIKDGALGDMFMKKMHGSPRRPEDEIRVTRGLLRAAFAGLSAKE